MAGDLFLQNLTFVMKVGSKVLDQEIQEKNHQKGKKTLYVLIQSSLTCSLSRDLKKINTDGRKVLKGFCKDPLDYADKSSKS